MKAQNITKKALDLVTRTDATLANITEAGKKDGKATFNQVRALVKNFVGMHALHNKKNTPKDTVDALRGSMQRVRQYFAEDNGTLTKLTRETVVQFCEAQVTRNDAVKAEATAWEKALNMTINGFKSKAHKVWAAAVVASDFTWQWVSKKAWPALKTAANDVWDWCRNLFSKKAKPEVSSDPKTGTFEPAVVVA